jgi:hypothetical protein
MYKTAQAETQSSAERAKIYTAMTTKKTWDGLLEMKKKKKENKQFVLVYACMAMRAFVYEENG